MNAVKQFEGLLVKLNSYYAKNMERNMEKRHKIGTHFIFKICTPIYGKI